MLIRKKGREGDQLIAQAGLFRVFEHDEWSVTIEGSFIEEKTGDPVVYSIVLSHGELSALTRYMRDKGVKPGRR